MPDEIITVKRRKTNSVGESSQETTSTEPAAPPIEPEIDIIGEGDDVEEVVEQTVTPRALSSPSPTSGEILLDESMRTPTKPANRGGPITKVEEVDLEKSEAERVFSSFPCQVIPETLGRMTRTPPDGEHLDVYRNSNGRLRIFIVDHFKKFSAYSNLTHKPCTVCNRVMKAGEMHLNFPADLDRRRIWANLLGFKYKDILRSKMGPVSFSIAAGPICTEHFAEECFRNHNFNKAAIEAFGVPVAISPDVKTTPSKKRVPWVCTICDFHSCSVVELQTHLLDHTEEMMKKKESILDVPDAGFMCPFCRKCTYGYKTVSGYRRHLNAGPIHHCHLRRIYEFAKMNCRATELDPVDSWDNWTRRNVYVAYHGCEPPANEIVLTPSPTKKAYVQNPEERTKMVHEEERRRKAVRTLSFVGKEGGTSVNDHNVMQRQVYLQIRRELELTKKSDGSKRGSEEPVIVETVERKMQRKATPEEEEVDVEVEEIVPTDSPQAPMGTTEKRKSPPTKKAAPKPEPPASSAPAKKRKRSAAELEPKEPTPQPDEDQKGPEEEEEASPNDPREKLRRKIRDERFAEMVQKRSQQVKRLMDAKKFKKLDMSPRKARKPLPSTIVKVNTRATVAETSSVEPEEKTSTEQTPEPSTSSTTKKSVPIARNTRSSKAAATVKSSSATPPPPAPPSKTAEKPKEKETKTEPPKPSKESKETKEAPKEPEERPLKSMLARSFAAGVRPSMAQYKVPIESFTKDTTPSDSATSSSSVASVGAGTSRSVSSGAILTRPPGSASPGGLFSQRVMGAVAQNKGPPAKRPTVLGRRPLILSPRKSGMRTSPTIPSPVMIPDDYLISAKDMEVEMVEEVIDSMGNSSEDVNNQATSSSSTSSDKPRLTLAEALAMEGAADGSVKEQEFEEISKKMLEETQYYRAMEDAIKGRTVTKMRADMRLSRHCIRQIEAARARARLFGEGSEDYQIYYSNDGAQVLSKNDPKWRDLSQQGPSDQH